MPCRAVPFSLLFLPQFLSHSLFTFPPLIFPFTLLPPCLTLQHLRRAPPHPVHVAHQDGDAVRLLRPLVYGHLHSAQLIQQQQAGTLQLKEVSRSLLGKDSSWQIFLQYFASSGLGLDLALRIFLKKTTTTPLKILEETRHSTELAAPTSFSSVRS